MPEHNAPAAVGPFPFHAVSFDKDGMPLTAFPVPGPDVTDVVIVSHGWNNSAAEAQQLYDQLFKNMAAVADLPNFPSNHLAVIGVFWPSKRFDFARDEHQAGGPAAGIGDGAGGGAARVDTALADLRNAFAEESDDKRNLVEEIAALAARRNAEAVGKKLVEKLRLLLKDEKSTLAGSDAAVLFEAPTMPQVLYDAAKEEIVLRDDGTGAQARTPAAGIGEAIGGIDNAFENLLNVTSYYQMKKRAATVGSAGVAALIETLAESPKIRRIHLVGHSFGGRLVTAAAMAAHPTAKLHSMSLLQAAFSHNGFAQAGRSEGSDIPEGYFRRVISERRVKGPILVTFSRHDHAVGKAYAIASRLNREKAAGLGDASDPYGGIGANGAQRLDPANLAANVTALKAKGGAYQWEPGKVHNLNSDQFISDHGDVENPHVAWAIASAIAS